MPVVFKICRAAEWAEAQSAGVFLGSPVDARDGYIHFSSAEQVADTAARHFAGVDGLVLVAVDADTLGSALAWEAARGGALFPHLYAPLSLASVLWTRPLPLGRDGRHLLPDMSAP